jgi:AraC-like DNA-binding protein
VDPEFSHYVASTLSTLVLDTKGLASFKRLAEALAHLMSQDCDANTVYDGEVEALRKELAPARLADRMWEVAQAIVDERTSRAWASPMMSDRLRHAGFAQYPEQVIAGLFVSRAEGADPVDEMLRRDAFQRAMVELSGKVGAAATGRIGGHGITLFSTNKSSPARTRRHLLDVAERARSLARQRYGLLWHVGLGTFPAALPEQYQTALAAAESAVSQGVRVSDASSQKPGADPLALLRRELPTLLSEKPAALPARLEQYFEAVLARWGHRVDLVRVYLEAAFEPIAEAVAGTDAIDEKSFASLRSSLRRTANDATTLGDLLAAYRSAINDIVGGAVAPRAAPRDRSLRRAEAYMRAHYAEPLTLARVAREAGLAPGHFSRLFHQKERVTFQTYLMRLRVERGQQLLAATALDLSHVARLSGLSTAEYFGRIFRRSTGETPIAYRRRVRAAQPA